jgi:hypothetical protein
MIQSNPFYAASASALRALAVALLPTLAAPHPVNSDEPRELEPQGDFVHPTAGFVLPETVGEFRRVAVTQFDEGATDISAGYVRAAEGGKVWPINATVYVYPVREPRDIDEYFTKLLADIGRQHGGAEPDFRQHATLSQGRFVGRYAGFGFEEPFFGVKLPLRSYLLLYHWKDWWVKWRVTTPAPRDDEPIRAMVTLTETLVPPSDDRAVGPVSR